MKCPNCGKDLETPHQVHNCMVQTDLMTQFRLQQANYLKLVEAVLGEGTMTAEFHDVWEIARKHREMAFHKGLAEAHHPSVMLAELTKAFEDMLVAEVYLHGGIPHHTREEMDFREKMAEFLEGQEGLQHAAKIPTAEELRDRYTTAQFTPGITEKGEKISDPHWNAWIKIGVQAFQLGAEWDTREEADWLRLMVGKAFHAMLEENR